MPPFCLTPLSAALVWQRLPCLCAWVTAASNLWSEQITTQALQAAAAAISTGKLYLCDAGTIAIYTPGIPRDKASLVRHLPHRVLPSGCIDPEALRSVAYAEVFNGEIVRYLSPGGTRKTGTLLAR